MIGISNTKMTNNLNVGYVGLKMGDASLRLVASRSEENDDKPMDLGMTGICKPTEVSWLENAVNNPGTSPVRVAIQYGTTHHLLVLNGNFREWSTITIKYYQ